MVPEAIRSTYVDMFKNRDVFNMFPSIDSAGRRFASLHWVLQGEFPQLRRYYQSATTSCRPSRRTSFPSFGGASVAPVIALFDGRVHRRSLELVTRCPTGNCRGDDRISQVPGEFQLSVCTCSKPTPAGRQRQTSKTLSRGPWYEESKGSHERTFGAQ